MRKSKAKAPKRKVTAKKVVKKTINLPKPITTEQFNKMPVKKRRIMVAKDVLLQLEAGKIKAETGHYIQLKFVPDIDLKDSREDIKKNYDKISECRVCALGASIMSCTRLGNQLKFEDIGAGVASLNNSATKGLLRKVFTPKQLMLIETAFEGHSPSSTRVASYLFGLSRYDSLTNKEVEDCNKFRYRIEDVNDRLGAIMKNIIKNKGIFKPHTTKFND